MERCCWRDFANLDYGGGGPFMQFWKDVISQGMAAANMSLEGLANIDLKQTMSGFEIRTQVMDGAASYSEVTVDGISMKTIEATGTLKLVSVKFWLGGIDEVSGNPFHGREDLNNSYYTERGEFVGVTNLIYEF